MTANKCLETRTFPRIWKVADVPGKNRIDPKSYRPICLLPMLGKVLDCLMISRMENWISSQGGGYNANQFGFTRGRSARDEDVWETCSGCQNAPRAYTARRVSRHVTMGCPQGSRSGAPKLFHYFWKIIHETIFEEMLPEGCNLILYADDTMLIETVGRRKIRTATKEELQRQLGIDATQIEGDTHCTGANAVHPANVGIGAFKEADEEEEETHNVIYTNGAKTAEGAGAAFILYTGQHKTAHKKLMLAKYCSAFQCELVAIRGALSYIREYGITRCTINTDSKSALQALQGMRVPTQLTRDIENLANELARTTNLQWRWTKGQAGNTGNERADQLAKEAVAGDPANAISYDLVPISMMENQQQRKNNSRVHTNTDRQKVPRLDYETVQLMTGRGAFSEYLTKIGKMDDATCECSMEADDTRHTLFNCELHAEVRTQADK
ncbi:hypothetical protein CBL_20267 [Carabus blaptoides fortunei]